jgi:hypothetical protein
LPSPSGQSGKPKWEIIKHDDNVAKVGENTIHSGSLPPNQDQISFSTMQSSLMNPNVLAPEPQKLKDDVPVAKPKNKNKKKSKGKGKAQASHVDNSGAITVLADKTDMYNKETENKVSEKADNNETTGGARKRSSTLMDSITQPVKDFVSGLSMSRKSEQ